MFINYNNLFISEHSKSLYIPRFFEPWLDSFGWVNKLPKEFVFDRIDTEPKKNIKPIKSCLVITGGDRVGKDTLAYNLNRLDSRFVPLGFADLVKILIAKDLYHNWGFEARQVVDLIFEEKLVKKITKEEVRQLYKFHGESTKKLFGKDFWALHTLNRIQILLEKGKIPVITDLRFPEEREVIEPWTKEFVTLDKIGDNEKYLKNFNLKEWK